MLGIFTILFSLITRYRAEKFTPPYLETSTPRITITSFAGSTNINKAPISVQYNAKYEIIFTLANGAKPGALSATLIHNGFTTHSQTMSIRSIKLQLDPMTTKADGSYAVNVWMPPNSFIVPPGPQYVYLLNDGVPGMMAVHVLIG